MRVLEAKTGFLAEEDNVRCRERARGEREGLEVNFSGEENEREESRETAVIFLRSPAHKGNAGYVLLRARASSRHRRRHFRYFQDPLSYKKTV